MHVFCLHSRKNMAGDLFENIRRSVTELRDIFNVFKTKWTCMSFERIRGDREITLLLDEIEKQKDQLSGKISPEMHQRLTFLTNRVTRFEEREYRFKKSVDFYTYLEDIRYLLRFFDYPVRILIDCCLIFRIFKC